MFDLPEGQTSSQPFCKFRLNSLSYWTQGCNIRSNGGKALLICRFLLELPFLLLMPPHLLAYEARSRSTVFHPKYVISLLKQIFHTRDIQSNKMVRRHGQLRNPNVSNPSEHHVVSQQIEVILYAR
jgi:hypothetical protein